MKGERYTEEQIIGILKAHDLITGPAFVLMKAADPFPHPAKARNQLCLADFGYLKAIGWGWFYPSKVLGDYSLHLPAWKLCGGTADKDVSGTIEPALKADGLESVKVGHWETSGSPLLRPQQFFALCLVFSAHPLPVHAEVHLSCAGNG